MITSKKFTLHSLSIFCVTAALFCSSCGPKKTVLYVYNWSDYLSPDLITAFEKENNCVVKIDTFDTNEAMYSKITAGGAAYDVIFPSTYFIQMLVDNKLVQPLNHALLPNVAANFDHRIGDKIYDSKMVYSVPYTINYTGLAYRKDKVDTVEASWESYMEARVKGRSTMLSDMHMTLGAALKTLGYSLNSSNELELAKARDVVIRWKSRIARFENEAYKTGLASGEFLLCMAYSGDIVQVQEESKDVVFVYPKEGYPCSCDEMVIPSNARHVELAHKFINFIYDSEWAAKNIAYTGFYSPVTHVAEKLPEKYRNNLTIFPKNEDLARGEVMRYLGEATRLYTKMWDQILAATGE